VAVTVERVETPRLERPYLRLTVVAVVRLVQAVAQAVVLRLALGQLVLHSLAVLVVARQLRSQATFSWLDNRVRTAPSVVLAQVVVTSQPEMLPERIRVQAVAVAV